MRPKPRRTKKAASPMGAWPGRRPKRGVPQLAQKRCLLLRLRHFEHCRIRCNFHGHEFAGVSVDACLLPSCFWKETPVCMSNKGVALVRSMASPDSSDLCATEGIADLAHELSTLLCMCMLRRARRRVLTARISRSCCKKKTRDGVRWLVLTTAICACQKETAT